MIRIAFKNGITADFPDLTVIIGKNGSGKTRLLKRLDTRLTPIVEANIAVFDKAEQEKPKGVVYYQSLSGDEVPNWGSIVTDISAGQNAGHMSSTMAAGSAMAEKERLKEAHLAHLTEIFGDGRRNGHEDALIEGTAEDLLDGLEIEKSAEAIAHAVRALDEIGKSMEVQLQAVGGVRANSESFKKAMGKNLRQATDREIRDFQKFGIQQAFQIDLSQMIAPYRTAQLENIMAEITDRFQETTSSLTDKEFEEFYGSPPWTFLNEALTRFGLPYQFSTPPADPREQYLPQLKNAKGEIIPPSGLSSGELVLFRLALSLMQYDERRMDITYPQLLLLDEVDASLDPDNLQIWLNALTNSVINQMEAHVILTTHSPITVAMAPEESLFELVQDGEPPVKISRREALDKLTIGLPTLAVEPDDQRQIFTESVSDQKILQDLVAKVKGRVDMPLALNFIRTGMDDRKGEKNAGCAVVRSLVGQLREAGNRTVRGLIDWDGKNVTSDGVHVIGEGSHYSIENILLDPLLVAAASHSQRAPDLRRELRDLAKHVRRRVAGAG